MLLWSGPIDQDFAGAGSLLWSSAPTRRGTTLAHVWVSNLLLLRVQSQEHGMVTSMFLSCLDTAVGRHWGGPTKRTRAHTASKGNSLNAVAAFIVTNALVLCFNF